MMKWCRVDVLGKIATTIKQTMTAMSHDVHCCDVSLSGCPVQVTANYTCNGQPSALFDTTNVAVLKAANLTLRPGKQPDPGCGGKPAVAIFRYQLRGLQLNQDFKLTAEVAPNCTARLISREFRALNPSVIRAMQQNLHTLCLRAEQSMFGMRYG
jgi:hypothetical protein